MKNDMSKFTIPQVSIIILNWNGWKDTIECLESLYQIYYDNYNIILVDNNSNDNSIVKIKEFCANGIYYSPQKELKPKMQIINIIEYEEKDFNNIETMKNKVNNDLIILKNSKNYGFAKGNNIGIKYALKFLEPDYILLLNNDTIVDPNFLNELIKVTNNQNGIGIYGPKLLNANNPQLIDSTGHILSWGRIVDRGCKEIDTNQFDNKLVIIGAKAAAALYSVKMLNSIGLLNENFIINYEDAELSWRAHKNSWKSIYVPKAIVYHKIGKSIRKDKKTLSKMVLLSLNNTIFTVKKYGSPLQKFLFTLILVKEIFLVFLRKIISRPNYLNVKQIIAAITELYRLN